MTEESGAIDGDVVFLGAVSLPRASISESVPTGTWWQRNG
jgi:hypothetical protein